jgi:hypothetical protein
MHIALVMPSVLRTTSRAAIARKCFQSLLLTERKTTSVEVDVTLYLLTKTGIFTYPIDALRLVMRTLVLDQKVGEKVLQGCDQPMVYGCTLARDAGADYLVQLGDDTFFHPRWLENLVTLLEAKPHAVAWSVYRSAREDIHSTLAEEGPYVRVRSINGNGLTVSSHEWTAWGLKWAETTAWESANGNTIDMHHLSNRHGERWVTKESWIEHAALKGDHSYVGCGEVARDFQKPDDREDWSPQ